jgi:hypothetical protein
MLLYDLKDALITAVFRRPWMAAERAWERERGKAHLAGEMADAVRVLTLVADAERPGIPSRTAARK